jgi:hypothetical protein
VLGYYSFIPDGHCEAAKVNNVSVLSVVRVNMCFSELQTSLPIKYAKGGRLKPYLVLSLLAVVGVDVDSFCAEL